MRPLRLLLTTAASIITAGILSGSETPETSTHVGVLVHNAANAPADILLRAQTECRKILQTVGIHTVWINTLEDIRWDGPAVVIRAAILPRAPKSKGIGVFGSAFPGKTSEFQVYIYYDHVIALSRQTGAAPDLVLFGAFTHEIGHMLLQCSEHAVAGIMRSEWGEREISELRQGMLGFTAQQKRQMRAYVDGVRAKRGSALMRY